MKPIATFSIAAGEVRTVLRTKTLALSYTLFVVLGSLPSPLLAQKAVPVEIHQSGSLFKSTGEPRYSLLNINNLTTWHRNDGHANHSPGADNGVYFPRGTANVIYQDCLIWGGKVYTNAALTSGPGIRPLGDGSQPVRVGGGTYSVGTRAGSVIGMGENAVAEDPDGIDVRMYRIRRDYSSMTEAELRTDAASFYEHESDADVTPGEINAIRAQYALDWISWPVGKGAPYIDRNANGAYDPPPNFSSTFSAESLISQGYDEPGIGSFGSPADQVIWTVYNDLDAATARNFLGSYPLGLEIQKTVWGYNRKGALGDVYFSRYRIINVGGVDTSGAVGDQIGSFWIDSMYICQWSDPDLGSFSDDLKGCDTVLNIGYDYNGNRVDASFALFSLPPPAVGYDILAGPTVAAPGDSALKDLRWVQDLRNLHLTSFTYFGAGDPYSDPPGGSDNYQRGTGRWWKLLRGYAPLGDFWTEDIHYQSPPEVGPSFYGLSGDPVTGDGWIDGQGEPWSFIMGDNRIMMSTGPFDLAPGDTQEVYIAFVAGMGADNLSSISVMKSHSRIVQAFFDRLFTDAPILESTSSVMYPDGQHTEIAVMLTPQSDSTIQSIEMNLVPQLGDEPSFSFSLLDDGGHNDGLAGDGVWGGDTIVANRIRPYRASLSFQTDAAEVVYEEFLSGLILRPKPVLENWRISYEDGRQDGAINPDETVLLRFDIRNPDSLNAIGSLSILNTNSFPIVGFGSNVSIVDTLAPGAITSSESYALSLRASSDAILRYSLSFDGNYESRSDTLTVQPWTPPANWKDTIQVVSVKGPLWVTPVVADASSMTGHDYLITYRYPDSLADQVVWSVKDVMTDSILVTDAQLWPGDPVWPHPIADGIQFIVSAVKKDIAEFQVVANANGPLPSPEPGAFALQGFPTPRNDNPSSAQQVGAGRWAIHTWPDASSSVGGSRGPYSAFLSRSMRGLNFDQLVPYDWEMRFTDAGSYAVRAFQDGVVNAVPFELWNIGVDTPDDPDDDYRLIPWLYDLDGNGVYGMINDDHPGSGGDNDPYTDPVYWRIPQEHVRDPWEPKPPVYGTTGYDNFVNRLNLTSTPPTEGTYGYDGAEVIARTVLVNWNGNNEDLPDPAFPANINQLTPETGTVFRIVTNKPNLPGDSTIVRSSIVLGVADGDIPISFSLSQNYPNPFNPTTTIRYALPVAGKVTLRIYNLLGQRIAELVNTRQNEGVREIDWDARNVSSGMYFYRIEMKGVDGDRFVKTRKMILLK